jgi:hypothetical protein
MLRDAAMRCINGKAPVEIRYPAEIMSPAMRGLLLANPW